MNRDEFARRLQSISIPEGTTVEDIQARVLPIREAIVDMIPQSLFKYRSCIERHIDSFEKDVIVAVPADWFNDPYDTMVRYDYEGIRKYVETIVSPEGLEQLKSFYAQGNDFPDAYKQILPDEFWGEMKSRVLEITEFEDLGVRLESSKQQLLSLISTFFPILSFFSKRFSTIACFSEDVKSILMWSHYADSHKGFALEYDFRPTLIHPLPRVGVFPVVYSEERYDASSYLTWALLKILGVKAVNPDMMASIKAALFKSKQWIYEKEWRMVDPGPHDILNPTPSVIEYRPIAIYYGRNIEAKNKERLHRIAESKGIKEYEMVIDYAGEKYEMGIRGGTDRQY